MDKMPMSEFHKELSHIHDAIHKHIPSPQAHASVPVHAVTEALHGGPLAAVIAHLPQTERKLHVIDEKLKADFLHFHDEAKKAAPAGEHHHAPAEHVERLQAYKKYIAARMPTAK